MTLESRGLLGEGRGFKNLYELVIIFCYLVFDSFGFAITVASVASVADTKVPVYKVWTGSNGLLCKYCVVGSVVLSVCYCLGSNNHYHGPHNTMFT